MCRETPGNHRKEMLRLVLAPKAVRNSQRQSKNPHGNPHGFVIPTLVPSCFSLIFFQPTFFGGSCSSTHRKKHPIRAQKRCAALRVCCFPATDPWDWYTWDLPFVCEICAKFHQKKPTKRQKFYISRRSRYFPT